MSRAGWKIPKRVDVLNITVIEFNRKWEQKQILQIKSGLFLLSLRYIAWLEEKLNLHEFNWNLKFFMFHRGKEKSDIDKNRTKCLCPYLVLAFRLFTIYHQCILLLSHALLELQNFANEKENYNFHEKAATNIQSLYALGFFTTITRAFVN